MIVSTLAALALSAASVEAGDIEDEFASNALAYCGDIDAVVIDARETASVSDLVWQVKQSGAQAVAITGAQLYGADMRVLAPYLGGGCIVDSTLKDTNWIDVSIPDLRIVRTDLEGANFIRATLPRVRFEGAALAGADFSDARLVKARFVGAYGQFSLGNASFARADLSGVVFECGITVDAWCVDGYEARFPGARLTGADIASFGIWDDAMLNGAILDHTAVNPRSLRYLESATLAGPLILRADLYELQEDGTAPAEAVIEPAEFRQLVTANASFNPGKPSFDCARAATTVEKLICGEYAGYLRSRDRDMAQLYAEARRAGKVTATSQKQWLAQRDRCTDEECVDKSYAARMDQIFAAMGPGAGLAPDQSVTYYQDVLPLPSSMRGSELYERILPVLTDASWQYIKLTGMEDGSISAEGFALGANAHTCDLAVDSARWNAKTGWYSARADDGTLVPLFRIWGERLLMRYSGNSGDTPDEAQSFISCGMRASFIDLRDLGE